MGWAPHMSKALAGTTGPAAAPHVLSSACSTGHTCSHAVTEVHGGGGGVHTRLPEAQACFHHMLWAKASPKGSLDPRARENGLYLLWEELQSHMAKAVATGKGGSQGHVFHQIGFDHTRGPMCNLRLPGLSLATSGFPTSALPFHLLPWLVFFSRQARQDASLMEATSPRICTTYSSLFPRPSCTCIILGLL